MSDLRDESTEETRIVVELKMGEIERVTMNKLYKLTAMEVALKLFYWHLINLSQGSLILRRR